MSSIMSNWIPHHVNPYPSDFIEQISCVAVLLTVAHRISECNRIRSVEAEYDNDTAVANCVASNNTHFRVMLYQGETQGTIIVDMRRMSGSSMIRISECNRIRSVEAEYDNDTAVANCVASNNTHFRVMLYQGETQGTIIVDMRRMSGSSMIFQEEYRAIMSAAKFGEIWPREKLECLKITPSDKQYRNNGYIPLQDGVLEQTLLSFKNKLCSDCYDERMLALEEIASVTNPEHSYDETALITCKTIMEPKSSIREYVASIIVEKEVSPLDGKYVRTLALTILANAMSTLSEEKVLTPLIQDKWYTTSLMPSLIDEMKTAVKHPCNASLAAKCLSTLFANSLEACSQAEKYTLTVLEAAKEVGKASYTNLEKEAQIALETMMQHKAEECRKNITNHLV
eukprot:CAMPEP_0198276866 /NCGR_PEP_ID=MMETSP1447-20131203/65539_1 /TAXON_ID=420782 /ORGANISM="Chaetoceros dichaeta, Strain CCMP1751" /LENGTH=397 /DNA_ID=CAMNT_0043971839 /DNA_START=24 /DNA_END=1218 /DNA_ORIENTATION=-